MDRHSVFTDWKTQHSKDANSSQNYILYRFNTFPIKNSATFFIDIDKLILKFI